jgi:rhodanese-related sulfurtransferase
MNSAAKLRMGWLSLALLLTASAALGRTDDSIPPSLSSATNVTHLVEAAEADSLIAAHKVVILDVRTPGEFARGHLKGAINLDFHGKDFQAQLGHLDKRRSYLVHCAVGGRSARACKLMSELGFKSVYDLKGGIKAWEKAGNPVTKS